MLGDSMMILYVWIMIAAVVFFNILLLKKLMEHFRGGKLWPAAALCSVETACYLIPYFWEGRIFYIPEMAAGVLLFLICYALILKARMPDEETEKPDGKRTVLLLITPVTSMAALACLFLGDLKPYVLSVFCCGCILAANLSEFYLYHVVVQNYAHIRQRDIYRQQTDHYRNQLEVIGESQSRMRALRHDMKNHMLHLSAELRQGNYEDALRYLEDMEEELQNPTEYVRTGNREIDSLLNYKLQKAQQVLKVVESDIHVPVELMPKSFDINVILGNLLDNAIEAAQESVEKRLKLVIRTDRGVFLIHVANSCRNQPKKKGDVFFSTKEESGEHGIGLQNVRRMVERQNGNIEFTYNANIFSVEVMLYMNTM